MIGIMVFTTYDMLSEHDLFKPDSEIKNIGIISLLILEFLQHEASDFDCNWGREVVRLCDNAGIDLKKLVRKQISLKKKDIESLRQDVKDNLQGWQAGYDENDHENDMYKYYAEDETWTLKDDFDDYVGVYATRPERMWYRYDWQLEVSFLSTANRMAADDCAVQGLCEEPQRRHSLRSDQVEQERPR
jgi:hypothetical protein